MTPELEGYRGASVVVTGGAGFIGSHVVDLLLDHGARVTVVDDFSGGTRDNLPDDTGNLDIVEADVRDLEALRATFEGADIVVHMAVLGLRLSLLDPFVVHEVNATGTLNACAAALEHGVQRFVYVSSSEIYGSSVGERMDEGHPEIPTTPYGASKLAGEKYALSYGITWDLPATVVRPFNAYGPRAHVKGVYGEVIPRFAARILNGKEPVVFGDGRQTRDFTYVLDTARGILLAGRSDELVGRAVNIAAGEEVSIADLASMLLKKLGRDDLDVRHLAERPGDVRRHFAEVSLARETLGFEAAYPIDRGLDVYIEWLRNHLDHEDLSDALERDVNYVSTAE